MVVPSKVPAIGSVYLDVTILTPAMQSKEEINALLNSIAYKIRMHGLIFQVPRERALLPIGSSIIGEFSWEENSPYIKLIRLLALNNVDPTYWDSWSRILVYCNDLYLEEYRKSTLKDPYESKRLISRAIKTFKTSYREIKPNVQQLSVLTGNVALVSFSLAKNFIDLAELKYKNDDVKMAVAYLESALSTLHEMVDATIPETSVIAQ